MANSKVPDNPQRWVLARKWHRVAPDAVASGTVCGEPVPTGSRRASSREVAEHGERTRTSVCGTCEKLAELAPATVDRDDRLSRLTPEQLEIHRRREADRLQRAKLRKAGKKGAKRSRSKSVRTVSGGAPGLGKRR